MFNGEPTSYQDLATRALKGAQLLRKLGLRTGDGIVVVADNHPDSMALFWAAQMSGLAG
ncbi:MAG: AMP-binding protein [Gammaproteobacteria bacterium]|nr:AMP-binding protein [Gammaproteobacteria bacterium]